MVPPLKEISFKFHFFLNFLAQGGLMGGRTIKLYLGGVDHKIIFFHSKKEINGSVGGNHLFFFRDQGRCSKNVSVSAFSNMMLRNAETLSNFAY